MSSTSLYKVVAIDCLYRGVRYVLVGRDDAALARIPRVGRWKIESFHECTGTMRLTAAAAVEALAALHQLPGWSYHLEQVS